MYIDLIHVNKAYISDDVYKLEVVKRLGMLTVSPRLPFSPRGPCKRWLQSG